MRLLAGQILRFVAVGCLAAATHWVVAVACVEMLGLAPLRANVVGWLAAFCVSFAGHLLFTFRHPLHAWQHAAARFFLVSAGGFAVNEMAYAWLLHVSSVRYDVLLAAVLAGIAVGTFIASRLWAFRRTPGA
ncbi:GtrA family protein [Pigmentiphaga kullae]|uniref:Putative flippase GtrA n=1 Tax=Pigmentiphaga kullae TaxID=151784 RepID=A0A4V2F436_9BURK|nr:GtrA family protein [Pigmentiphaga kullae]RZS86237.1 putative flippase GtrA [Pigmentiphaga kullae]